MRRLLNQLVDVLDAPRREGRDSQEGRQVGAVPAVEWAGVRLAEAADGMGHAQCQGVGDARGRPHCLTTP